MKAHRTDAFSLTFGLIFLGAVAIWLVNRVVHTELPGVGWFIAGTLIVAGAVGLLTSLRSDRARVAEEADEQAGTAAVDEPIGDPSVADLDPYSGADADLGPDVVPGPPASHIEPEAADRGR
jgi:hypothetical protein